MRASSMKKRKFRPARRWSVNQELTKKGSQRSQRNEPPADRGTEGLWGSSGLCLSGVEVVSTSCDRSPYIARFCDRIPLSCPTLFTIHPNHPAQITLLFPSSKLQAPGPKEYARMGHATAPRVGPLATAHFHVQAGAIVPRCKHNFNMNTCCARLQGFRHSLRSLYPIRLGSAARATHQVGFGFGWQWQLGHTAVPTIMIPEIPLVDVNANSHAWRPIGHRGDVG